MALNQFATAGEGKAFCGGARALSAVRMCAAILSVAVAISCSACSSRRPPPPHMKLYVHSDQAINDGQLFYMVLRTVTDKQFLTDSYQTVAGLVFADPPDKTIIGSHVILPGNIQEFQVVQPEESPVAFYFFFTDPGDQWKKLLDQPLASAYNIKIQKKSVTVTPRRSVWKRILWPFGS